MRDKIISWSIWIFIWLIIIYWYWYFFSPNSWIKLVNSPSLNSELSDEQITRIAARTWLSESEIKSRLESGETMRNITWSNWVTWTTWRSWKETN